MNVYLSLDEFHETPQSDLQIRWQPKWSVVDETHKTVRSIDTDKMHKLTITGDHGSIHVEVILGLSSFLLSTSQ